MMRILFHTIVCLLLLGGFSSAAEDAKPKLWFPVGEIMYFDVYWSFVPVAEVKVSTEWINEDGRDLVAIRVTSKSNSFMDTFYPVDDFIESVVDPGTFIPIRCSRKLSEGRYKVDEVTTFDHKTGKAKFRDLLKKEEKEFAIEKNSRDLLTHMFYMRSQKLKPNKEYQYRVMADDKMHVLDVKTKKYEKIKLSNYGKVRSMKLEPISKFHGLFVRVGRIMMWISDDERHLATRATARVLVGRIKLVLNRVEGPGNDFWVSSNATSSAAATLKQKSGKKKE